MNRSNHSRLKIDLLSLRALLEEKAGDGDSALTTLGEAVQIAQVGHLVRPLADVGPTLLPLLNSLDLDSQGLQFIARVIAALRHGGSEETQYPLQQRLPEPLSNRELEILHLLAARLNNKEIAERLFISNGTVKRHTHNIYGKLAVKGRREAVTKALALELLQRI